MKIIGHRGAKGLAKENTLASFTAAINHGVDAIELDVRITRDGVAALVHDPTITVKGRELAISNLTFDELKQRLPQVTTLSEAIQLVDRRVPLLIEVKPAQPVEPVVEIVKHHLGKGWQPQDLSFISFDYQVLKRLRAAFPDHLLIVDEMWSGVRAAWRARRLGTRHISLSRRALWSGYIRAAKRGNYHLYTFTLNDPKKAARWKQAGLYGVITDYPDRFAN